VAKVSKNDEINAIIPEPGAACFSCFDRDIWWAKQKYGQNTLDYKDDFQ